MMQFNAVLVTQPVTQGCSRSRAQRSSARANASWVASSATVRSPQNAQVARNTLACSAW